LLLYISVFAFITLLCIGVYSYIVRNPLAEAFEGGAAGEAVEKKKIIAQSVDLIGSLAGLTRCN